MGSNQILKKSLVGGFKKEGVLNYIEGLQAEIVNLRGKLEARNNGESDAVKALKAEIDGKNEIIASLENDVAALSSKDEEINSLNAEIERLNAVIASMEEEKSAAAAEYDEKINAAKADYEEKANLCEEKISAIEEKFSAIEANYLKISETDSKVNTMMNNAIISSDKMIAEAKAKSVAITAGANCAVKAAQEEISAICSQLKTATVNYESAAVALKSRADSLLSALESITIEAENSEV